MDNTTAGTAFWANEPASDFPDLMPPELKERIAEERLAFTVLGIRDVATAYGPTWMLEVELDGERWTLPLGHTPRRDAQIGRLADHLERHGPVACGLAIFEGRNGRGWILTPPADATAA